MSNDIRIKKGLDIKLKGEAEKTISNAIVSKYYALRPEDFHSVIPKLSVKVGSKVKAGEPVFYNKNQENVKFASPVSGEVIEIARGEKRRILEIKIQADTTQTFQDNGKLDVGTAKAEEIKKHLLASGCWPFVKQRPYDVIANPDKSPKAIFVSAYASAPLVADLDFVLQGKEAELQAAVTALGKLTDGKVHVSVGKNSNSPLSGLTGIELHKVSGPHPSGNVGTQINKIDPINKGEIVWTVNAQDLVIIGELLLTGKFNAERIVAMVGSSISNPRYFVTKIGSEVSTMIYTKGIEKNANVRIISGNVLSGKQINPDGYLDYYSNTITVIPEGDDYEFFQAANLGANNGLRGYRNERFSGKSAFVQSTDLRFNLNRIKTSLIPFDIGFYGGFDYGRVWVDSEKSDTWNNSFGGGVFANALDIFVINLSAFSSDDGLRLAFKLGLGF